MKTQYIAVVAVVVATGGAVVWQAASVPLNAPATASVVVENAPVLDGVMRPSEFPGVETVSIPDPPKNSAVKVGSALDKKSQAAKKVVGKTADGKAWVRVLPGDKTPAGGYEARGQTTWHRENGKTPLGGIALIPDQNYLLHEVAQRDKNGALIYECAPGESAAQHAKHQAQHPAKPKQ